MPGNTMFGETLAQETAYRSAYQIKVSNLPHVNFFSLSICFSAYIAISFLVVAVAKLSLNSAFFFRFSHLILLSRKISALFSCCKISAFCIGIYGKKSGNRHLTITFHSETDCQSIDERMGFLCLNVGIWCNRTSGALKGFRILQCIRTGKRLADIHSYPAKKKKCCKLSLYYNLFLNKLFRLQFVMYNEIQYTQDRCVIITLLLMLKSAEIVFLWKNFSLILFLKGGAYLRNFYANSIMSAGNKT